MHFASFDGLPQNRDLSNLKKDKFLGDTSVLVNKQNELEIKTSSQNYKRMFGNKVRHESTTRPT